MKYHAVIVQGTLKPDGTLELTQPVDLPPGPVEVTVRPENAASSPKAEWWRTLQEIRAEREARGFPFLSDEEVTAHIEELRADDDR